MRYVVIDRFGKKIRECIAENVAKRHAESIGGHVETIDRRASVTI